MHIKCPLYTGLTEYRIMAVMKLKTEIITSITASLIQQSVMLVIMFVESSPIQQSVMLVIMFVE